MAEFQNTLGLGSVQPAPIQLPEIPFGPAVEEGVVLQQGANPLDCGSLPYVEFVVELGDEVGGGAAAQFANVLPYSVIAVYVKRTAALAGLLWDSRVKPEKGQPYPQPGPDVGAWSMFVFKALPNGSGGLVLLNTAARNFSP